MRKLSLFLVLIGLFMVSCSPKDPVVKTHSVTEITATAALGGGEVVEDGGADVIARGICWSTVENPTIADGHSNAGAGLGSFTSTMTELLSNTTYYVRAYATNSEGTSYGGQVSFMTLEEIIELATVNTSLVTSITSTSAMAGGDVTADGGQPMPTGVYIYRASLSSGGSSEVTKSGKFVVINNK